MILPHHLNFADLHALRSSTTPLELSPEAWIAINRSYSFLETYMARAERPVYGVNTGFGSLCDVQVSTENLEELQRNLLITHAAGAGAFLPHGLVRLMLLLKIHALSKGNSAISPAVMKALLCLYNNPFLPQVHEQGSLGASGDLAPLSELVLPLIGLGNLVNEQGEIKSAETWLQEQGLEPHKLHPKEALALINGTQFMQALGLFQLWEVEVLLQQIPRVAALSIEAFQGRSEPFMPQPHAIRPHPGQMQAAAEIYRLMQEAGTAGRQTAYVQDPYSFRCIPQVHGASIDAISHVRDVFFREMNSVTDNPNVFPEDGLVLSAGNFHGQPLALAADYLAMAMAELAAISERRTYLLISGQRGLPPFLAEDPGLDSGYMIAQYSAASMVSQNKQYCTPASVDSIMSSNGQEDHVSMGANAVLKGLKVLENTKMVLAVEFTCAARALSLRKQVAIAPELHTWLEQWKQPNHRTTPMNQIMEQARKFLFP
jgi:histidine ammonia-lyase